jgi:hypothetical protein
MTDTTIKTSRRALLAGVPAAALVVATPALANALSEPVPAVADPIFAAIDRHRTACDAARSVGDVCGVTFPDAPTYDAIHERFDEVNGEERKALVALLTCQPTTIAGILAVLEHVGRMNWVWGDDDDETIIAGAYERGIEEAKVFTAHLAASLRNIIERGH